MTTEAMTSNCSFHPGNMPDIRYRMPARSPMERQIMREFKVLQRPPEADTFSSHIGPDIALAKVKTVTSPAPALFSARVAAETVAPVV